MGSRVGNAGKSEAVLLITPGAYPQVSSIKWPSEPSQGCFCSGIVAVVQSLSRVQLSVTPWTTARQASLSFTISWSLLRLMSIELVMPSNHLIHCRPLLLLPSIFQSTKVFSSELAFSIMYGNPLQYSCLENPVDRGAW